MLEKVQTTVANLEKWERQIIQLKEIEEKFDKAKKELCEYMIENDFGSFDTNLLKFTLVKPTTSKTEVVIKFDEERFKKEEPMLYHKYLITEEKVSNGRAGYLKMTIKKEEG